jgi:pilus assembly protein Flp/PilA
MFHFISRIKKQRDKGKGQGLVEYALILVLVAIVVIAIVTIFGQTLSQTYCTVVVSLNKGTNTTFNSRSTTCGKPIVSCEMGSLSGGSLKLEAVVFDPDKPRSMTLTQAIDVQFYKNGVANGTVEQEERFCLGNSSVDPDHLPCSSTISVVSGDVIKAVATDNYGDAGECSYKVP